MSQYHELNSQKVPMESVGGVGRNEVKQNGSGALAAGQIYSNVTHDDPEMALNTQKVDPLAARAKTFLERCQREFGIVIAANSDDKSGEIPSAFEEKGFGWMSDTNAISALSEGIKRLYPQLDDLKTKRLAVHILAGGFKDDVCANVKDGVPVKTFSELVAEHVEKYNGQIDAIVARNELSAGELAAQLEDELDVSKYAQPVGTGLHTEGDIIRDNLRIIAQLHANYEAMKEFFDGVINERCTEADRARLCEDYYFCLNCFAIPFPEELKLHTVSDGSEVALHLEQGLTNFLQAVEIGMRFNKIYEMAVAQGKMDELYAALKEDGCLQARMGALVALEARLNSPDSVDHVEHSKHEATPNDWLVTELGDVVQEFMKNNEGSDPTWSVVKKRFAEQICGKTYVNGGESILWTVHQIYRYLTKDDLEKVLVEDPDDDFSQHKKNVMDGSIHYTEI